MHRPKQGAPKLPTAHQSRTIGHVGRGPSRGTVGSPVFRLSGGRLMLVATPRTSLCAQRNLLHSDNYMPRMNFGGKTGALGVEHAGVPRGGRHLLSQFQLCFGRLAPAIMQPSGFHAARNQLSSHQPLIWTTACSRLLSWRRRQRRV